jgi:hypothetical protein
MSTTTIAVPFLEPGQHVPCLDLAGVFEEPGHPKLDGGTRLDDARWQGQMVREAKAACAGCPVRTPCARWAYETRQFGVWGGTTDAERLSARRSEAAKRSRSRPERMAS